jgi:hypothetical protein
MTLLMVIVSILPWAVAFGLLMLGAPPWLACLVGLVIEWSAAAGFGGE